MTDTHKVAVYASDGSGIYLQYDDLPEWTKITVGDACLLRDALSVAIRNCGGHITAPKPDELRDQDLDGRR